MYSVQRKNTVDGSRLSEKIEEILTEEDKSLHKNN